MAPQHSIHLLDTFRVRDVLRHVLHL
jgi:hypothetical protein